MEKPRKEEGKQEWATKKPKLEHARDLRGVYSIDPSDEGYEGIIKNVRGKLAT